MERCWLFALSLLASVAFASEPVSLPGPGLELQGRLSKPAGDGPFPAIVMMHGCSGLWTQGGGQPTAHYRFWADHFTGKGYATLLLDSFVPRGQKEICTQKDRKVSESRDRPKDAHAALRWLAARPDIDPKRIYLMGWSNGAMATLHAFREDSNAREKGAPGFRAAIAFYPGCAGIAKSPYHSAGPLLILSGASDDWTPARYCEDLARAATGGPVEIEVFPDAHHGFDNPIGKVHTRPEVRNLASPSGWGATVGPNPQARAKAIDSATRFLAAH